MCQRDKQKEATQDTSDASKVKDSVQLLTFILNEELFSARIERVKEIIEYPKVTSIPMTPGFVRGVVNLRGKVVPVIDLAVRFGAAEGRAVSKKTCVVITEIERDEETHTLGLVVDRVNAVINVTRDQLEPRPDFGTEIRSDFIECVANVDDEFVLVLELDRVLSIDELERLSRLSARGSEQSSTEISAA
jgi:purine-binding chemotaxis protein CheW